MARTSRATTAPSATPAAGQPPASSAGTCTSWPRAPLALEWAPARAARRSASSSSSRGGAGRRDPPNAVLRRQVGWHLVAGFALQREPAGGIDLERPDVPLDAARGAIAPADRELDPVAAGRERLRLPPFRGADEARRELDRAAEARIG